MEEIIRDAAAAGWPVAVHAIGDRANRDALDAFEATQDAWKPLPFGTGSSMRSASTPQTSVLPSSASPAPRTVRQDVAERFWAIGSRLRFEACSSPEPCSSTVRTHPSEELDPLAGIRAGVLRTIDARLVGNRIRR